MNQGTGTRTRLRIVLFGVLAVAGLGASAQAGTFSEVVAFGDSLSDAGNVYIATGTPPAPYYQGRYSDGPVWVEYLAKKLGVSTPTPSLAGGTNNAWGGAESGAGDSFMGTPNIGKQIQGYLAAHPALNASQLVTIWGGANDFLNGGQTDPTAVVSNIASAIKTLADAGGSQFLLSNLPMLGSIPATSALPQAARDGLNYLALAFNGMLKTKVQELGQTLGVTIRLLDVDSVFRDIVDNPSAYGLNNLTDPAFDGSSGDGQGHLFWDTVHPTTTVHEAIGNAAFNAVVPEPSSIALLGISGVALSILGCRRASGRSRNDGAKRAA